MIGAALVAALALASQLQTHPTGLPSVGPSRANSLRTAPIMDKLYEQAGKPALDFDFARYKDLHDNASGKTSLVNFSRSAAQSPGTYVGADGLIKTAAVNLALYSEQFDNAVWTKSGADIAANQIIAPDGKQTADEIRAKAITTSQGISGTGASLASGTTYNISAHFKYVNHQWIWIRGDRPSTVWQAFDIQNGVIGNAYDPSGAISNASIQSVGSGWYRVSLNVTATSSGVSNIVYRLGNGSTPTGGAVATLGTERMGVWGAQLEETDPATMQPTAYIKTTSQALAAPRFDHTPTTGNLTTNLLTYSEMLDNPAWLTLGSCGVTANAETAPDGTTTADTITINTLSDGKRQITSLPATIGSQITASVWLKAGTATNAQLWILASGGGLGSKKENITLTSEWQRFSVTSDVLTSAGDNWRLRIYNNGETGTFHAWGAQLEASPTLGPYVRTLSETRSISDANAESLGLLVEEARTNLHDDSENLDGSVIRGGTGVTPTRAYDFGVSPAGTQTAERFIFDLNGGTAVGDYSLLTLSQFAVTAGDVVKFTVYAKTTDGSDQKVVIYSTNGGQSPAEFDVNGDWQRLTFTTNAASATGGQTIFLGSRGTYGGDDTIDVLLWGAQAEKNVTFPTSYIPTVTSQTRYADVAAVQDEDFSTTNLLAYSESFDVGWSTSRLRPVVSNVVVAPDGQTTADYIEQEAGQTNAGGVWKPETRTGLHNLSVYAKKKEKGFLRLTFAGAQSWIDLNDCSVGTTSASTIGVHAEDVGDGWCRVSATYNFPGTSTVTGFYVADTDGSSTVTDSGGLYLWGASLTATEYPVAYTTTRNLLTDSQDFERSGWAKLSGATIDNDVAQAPDGTLTADRINYDGTASGRIERSTSASGTVTQSIYLRTESGTQSVKIGSSSGSLSTVTVTTDWQRFTHTGTGSYPRIQSDDAGSILAWGAQLEPGTTATDYVRTVDTVGKAYGFYEPTEGTVFVEVTESNNKIGRALNVFGGSSRIVDLSRNYGNWEYFKSSDSSTTTIGSYAEPSLISVAIKLDDYNSAANGSVGTPDTSTGQIPSADLLRIGDRFDGARTLNGHIKRLTYWPVRQADSTLQVITQ